MLCIVVSCLPALFEWLMLLDYQIGLDFASGVGSWNVGELDIESAIARFSVLLCTTRIVTAYEPTYGLCRIRRAYIHIRHIGRAWQPSPTRRFWHPAQKRTSANIGIERATLCGRTRRSAPTRRIWIVWPGVGQLTHSAQGRFCVHLTNRIQPLDINQHHPLVWMFSHIVQERLIKSRAGKERIVQSRCVKTCTDNITAENIQICQSNR